MYISFDTETGMSVSILVGNRHACSLQFFCLVIIIHFQRKFVYCFFGMELTLLGKKAQLVFRAAEG